MYALKSSSADDIRKLRHNAICTTFTFGEPHGTFGSTVSKYKKSELKLKSEHSYNNTLAVFLKSFLGKYFFSG